MVERAPEAVAAAATGPGQEVDAGREPIFAAATLDFATRLAGVFFLVNFLPRLDLPKLLHAEQEEFEPGGKYFTRSGWPVVEALGRLLLGPRLPRFADDPIWPALRWLDGGNAALAEAQAAAAAPVGAGATIGGAGWASLSVRGPVARAVRARLAGMLGVPLRDVADVLLVRDGRALATRTHVDLYMAMDSISLPVRRAGLDANPGWQPALGRIVLFHYAVAVPA